MRSIILGVVLMLVILAAGFRFADYLYQDTASQQLQSSNIEPAVINADDLDASLCLNINTASASELEQLSGIGEIKAQAIIDYRAHNGNFLTNEDIMDVDGIGPAIYEDISELISVD